MAAPLPPAAPSAPPPAAVESLDERAAGTRLASALAPGEHLTRVTLRTGASGSYGASLQRRQLPDGGFVIEVLKIDDESPNRDVLSPGDEIVTVAGNVVRGNHQGVMQELAANRTRPVLVDILRHSSSANAPAGAPASARAAGGGKAGLESLKEKKAAREAERRAQQAAKEASDAQEAAERQEAIRQATAARQTATGGPPTSPTSPASPAASSAAAAPSPARRVPRASPLAPAEAPTAEAAYDGAPSSSAPAAAAPIRKARVVGVKPPIAPPAAAAAAPASERSASSASSLPERGSTLPERSPSALPERGGAAAGSAPGADTADGSPPRALCGGASAGAAADAIASARAIAAELASKRESGALPLVAAPPSPVTRAGLFDKGTPDFAPSPHHNAPPGGPVPPPDLASAAAAAAPRAAAPSAPTAGERAHAEAARADSPPWIREFAEKRARKATVSGAPARADEDGLVVSGQRPNRGAGGGTAARNTPLLAAWLPSRSPRACPHAAPRLAPVRCSPMPSHQWRPYRTCPSGRSSWPGRAGSPPWRRPSLVPPTPPIRCSLMRSRRPK